MFDFICYVIIFAVEKIKILNYFSYYICIHVWYAKFWFFITLEWKQIWYLFRGVVGVRSAMWLSRCFEIDWLELITNLMQYTILYYNETSNIFGSTIWLFKLILIVVSKIYIDCLRIVCWVHLFILFRWPKWHIILILQNYLFFFCLQ